MKSRREFLLDGTALTLAVGLAPTALAAVPWSGRNVALHQISVAAFVAHAGTTFRVVQTSGAVTLLKLVEVTGWSGIYPHFARSEDEGNEKFSLLFRGPRAKPLAQNTYVFDHAEIGHFSMFITLIGSTDRGYSYYEAVFNRPVAAGSEPLRRTGGAAGNIFVR
jgi:hypothetical protein